MFACSFRLQAECSPVASAFRRNEQTFGGMEALVTNDRKAFDRQ